MRRIFVELSGLILVSSSLSVVACGSSGGGACDALSACCASLAGPEGQQCSAAVSQSGASDSECASALSTYQAAGVCTSGSGSGSNEGGTVFKNPDSGSGIPTDPCGALTACCSNVPVAGDPMACLTVSMEGTPMACLESLESYVSAGYCTGPGGPTLSTGEVDGGAGGPGDAAVGPSTCFALSGSGSEMSCEQFTLPSGSGSCSTISAQASVGLCPTAGLYGCCVQSAGSGTGPETTAVCVYSEAVAMALQSNCSSPGHWQTTLP